MKYLDYEAVVEYDPVDKLVVGYVVGIKASLNFHGISYTDAEENFHQCIDNYLAMCKRKRRKPERPKQSK